MSDLSTCLNTVLQKEDTIKLQLNTKQKKVKKTV
jgi:hypothetical protein